MLYYLDNFLRVPHGVFKISTVTFHTALSEQFEHDVATLGLLLQVKPKRDPALHRRPPMAAVLRGKGTIIMIILLKIIIMILLLTTVG